MGAHAESAMAADRRHAIEGGTAIINATGEWRAANLLEDDLPRVVRRVAIPAVASNLLMTLFASVDAYWVGTRIGPAALAAVSTSLFWIWSIVSLAEMIGVGLTAVAARRHGEGRPIDAARAVGDAMRYGIGLGLIVAIAGTFTLDRLFAVMQTPADVTALGRSYLHAYLLGAPLIYGYFAVDAAFRASGDTRTPLVLLSASVAATLLLDPVLILGLAGAPRLGITGAAVALVLTRGAAFAIGVFLLRRRGMLRFGRLRWANIAAVSRVGLPTAVTGIIFSVIYVGMTRTTTRFGTPALAALGIGHRVESWLFMIGVGFGAAAAAIVGQNLGAGRTDRAMRAGWITTAYATVPAFVSFAAELLVPEHLAALFSADPAVIAVAASYLRIAAVSQLLICSEIVLEGALGGAGDTIPPMLTSTTLTALRIPLAAWSASRWGIDGVWWTISLTAMGRALAMMLLWRSGRWMRRSV
jgi:putative MATE family efflux protein